MSNSQQIRTKIVFREEKENIMQSKNSIIIKKVIIHVLDSTMELPVISDTIAENNPIIYDFISNHIEKVLQNEGTKSCEFHEENNTIFHHISAISKDSNNFTLKSQDLALSLYGIMKSNASIPPADVAMVLFNLNGVENLAILKLNYKHSFIHSVHTTDNKNIADIIILLTSLPSDKQKVDEAIIVDLQSFNIKLLEKKYEIKGDLSYYLSIFFLNCYGDYSNKEKLQIFKRTADKIGKSYFEDDLEKKMEFKKAVVENIGKTGELNIEEVVNTVYSNNIDIKDHFKEEIENYNFKDTTVQLSEQTVNKNFQKQLIKTDSGIELKIPIEQYDDFSKIEFVTNEDGTISILIKNINKLTYK